MRRMVCSDYIRAMWDAFQKYQDMHNIHRPMSSLFQEVFSSLREIGLDELRTRGPFLGVPIYEYEGYTTVIRRPWGSCFPSSIGYEDSGRSSKASGGYGCPYEPLSFEGV